MRYLFIIVVLASLSLAGCTRQSGFVEQQQAQQVQQNKLQQQRSAIAHRLTNQGLAVYLIGDNINVLVPANSLFIGSSPNLASHANQIFANLVALANSYPNVMIHIAAYTHKSANPARDQGLTELWAQVTARHLWQRGIDTRFLYASGRGACDLLSVNDKTANDRLEIKFRVTEQDEDLA